MKINNPYWADYQKAVVDNDEKRQEELRLKVTEFNNKLLATCEEELTKKLENYEVQHTEIVKSNSKKDARKLYQTMIEFHRECKKFTDRVKDLKDHVRAVSLGKTDE